MSAAAPPALFRNLASHAQETCAFAYLDNDGRVLGLRHFPLSDIDAIDVPIRAVAADVVAFDATQAIMAHNHPSGDPMPSAGDVEVTRRIDRALATLGVRLIDHFVISRNGSRSFRSLNVL